MVDNPVTRRSFIKTGLAGIGAVSTLPFGSGFNQAEWPDTPLLGRVTAGKIDLKQRPSVDSKATKSLYEDAIVGWLKEVIGEPNLNRGKSRRWVETPDGFIYAPDLQPVRNLPNKPVSSLPTYGNKSGMWAEITVPLVYITIANPPVRAEVLKHSPEPHRLYYSQVFWIDDVRNLNGKTLYRVNEPHGGPGDIFWADAAAFRPITPADITTIRPEAENKKIVVNLSRQTLACYEGNREVFFCRVSTGAKFDAYGKAVEKWSTPVGLYHVVSRKFISLHMAGGSAASGYELLAVSWTSIFASGGVAVHGTYWHNNFGEPMSHGCVNALPEDARWVYRWTMPFSPYDPGKIEVSGYEGTKVEVVEVKV